MSKGLKALYDLVENPYYIELGRVQGKKQFAINFRIIEEELKRLEVYDKCDYQTTINKNVLQISKELKALEIIKEYELDMKVIIYCIKENIDYVEYVERRIWIEAQDKSPMKPMSQEEFNLLKEALL